MNNQEIINSWNEWCNKLSSFKISDVKAGRSLTLKKNKNIFL